MNAKNLRRALLTAFIVFLALTALVAIVSILSGSFGEVQLRIILTTVTISSASICGMSCAAYLEREAKNISARVGMAAATFGALMLISAIWAEIDNEIYLKIAFTFTVIAIAFAHGFLLLFARLAPEYRWTQAASRVVISALAAQIIVAFWLEIDNQTYLRFIAVTAILAVLNTLVIPIYAKLKPQSDATAVATREVLVLEHLGDDRYVSEAGKLYRVTAVDDTLPS